MNLEINYLPYQLVIFNNPARVKIIPKGRRVGFTHGVANYCIDELFNGSKILWVDTISANIERYFDRYFMPTLRKLPPSIWKFKLFQKTLLLHKGFLDFRSADKPENIEGFAYDLIIINEAGIVLKNEYLWNNAILPMTLDYKARMIVGGTPKGKRNKKLKKDHLFFELYKKANSDEYPDWESFQLSSYDNPLINDSDIDELFKEIPPGLRDQEIYGKFIDESINKVFNTSWFKFYDEPPIRFDFVLDSWDTAFKKNEENDFSAKITIGVLNDRIYVLDYYKDRLEYPELRRQVEIQFNKNNANSVLIEDKASGQSIIQDLERNTFIPIRKIKIDTDKIARAHSITPLIEAGRVYLPSKAKWVAEFFDSLNDFPLGEHDDDIDAFTQALSNINNYQILDEDSLILPDRNSITDNY